MEALSIKTQNNKQAQLVKTDAGNAIILVDYGTTTTKWIVKPGSLYFEEEIVDIFDRLFD